MTTVVFETASVADAIKKAARVAPAKSGSAFDKAAGIVLDIFPEEEVKCVVRATDTDVFYAEVLGTVSASGPEVRWRLPSMVLAGVLAQLPITSGKQVSFTQIGSEVHITTGRMKAKLRLMDPTYYPDWDMFGELEMANVQGLGGRVAQVEWAASTSGEPPMCGVLLDGDYAIATDRYRIARIPCKIPLDHPVTIPAGILGSILKPMGDVQVAVDGSTLCISIDDYTQVKTIIYDMPFPPVQKAMENLPPESVKVSKALLLSKLNTASSFAGTERSPRLKLYIGKEEIAVFMENQEVGLLGDIIDITGQGLHQKRVVIVFSPKNIITAIDKCPNTEIEIRYNPENPVSPFYVNGGSGYEAWIMPLKDVTTQ